MTRHPSGLMRMTAAVERALIRSQPVTVHVRGDRIYTAETQ